jgi:hypothetical protein
MSFRFDEVYITLSSPTSLPFSLPLHLSKTCILYTKQDGHTDHAMSPPASLSPKNSWCSSYVFSLRHLVPKLETRKLNSKLQDQQAMIENFQMNHLWTGLAFETRNTVLRKLELKADDGCVGEARPEYKSRASTSMTAPAPASSTQT